MGGILSNVNFKVIDFKNDILTGEVDGEIITVESDDIFKIGETYKVNLYYDSCEYYSIELLNN